MTIEYRVVHDPEELKVIVELETIVWSMPASEAVPHNMLFALIHSGGVVIRADQDGTAVGFALAIVALRGKEPILWSHMAGVIPEHQSSGIGFALKQAQRIWALEHGFKVIAWTFDPLQRKNAKFNLHLLKGVTSSYHINFYGEMMDGINKGMPSDRLEVDWNLEAEVVIAAANGATPTLVSDDYPAESFLLHSLPDGLPYVQLPSALSEKRYYVEIPYHLAVLKRDNIQLAKNWQIGLREAMGSAFAQGFTAVDFVNAGERCWYVLEKS